MPEPLTLPRMSVTTGRPSSHPVGRDADPGRLCGAQKPGEWPAGGHPQCRRCTLPSTLEGHPYGCPRTPWDSGPNVYVALRFCYCGETFVAHPSTFGPCCEGTPPVLVPGGCRWCGTGLCEVNNPDQYPENESVYDIPDRYPGLHPRGGAWVHAACVDEWLLTRGDRFADIVAARVSKRHLPVGGTL